MADGADQKLDIEKQIYFVWWLENKSVLIDLFQEKSVEKTTTACKESSLKNSITNSQRNSRDLAQNHSSSRSIKQNKSLTKCSMKKKTDTRRHKKQSKHVKKVKTINGIPVSLINRIEKFFQKLSKSTKISKNSHKNK